MWEYEDPKQHLRRYIQRRVEQRGDLERSGVPAPQMNERLQKAAAERIYEEARTDYEERSAGVLLHNLGVIDERYRRKEGRERWKRYRRASQICLAGALMFGALACYYFFHYVGGDRALAELLSVGFFLAYLAVGLFLRALARTVSHNRSHENHTPSDH